MSIKRSPIQRVLAVVSRLLAQEQESKTTGAIVLRITLNDGGVRKIMAHVESTYSIDDNSS